MTSERVEQLDPPAEVFYRRLMSKVDDHGLYDARPSILRASLYPLRIDRVREADCSRWIAACEKAGLIALYQHDGKTYLQMIDTRWATRSEPKYPAPPWGLGNAPENSCAQMETPVPVFGDGDGDGDDKPRKRGFDPSGIQLPEWLPLDIWDLWVHDRKVRGKKLTEAAARLSVKKLAEFREQGHSPQSVIEHSIANGYQGLFAPARNGSQPKTHETAEHTKQLIAEHKAHEAVPPSPEVLARLQGMVRRIA